MQWGGTCPLPGEAAQKQDRSLRYQHCCHLLHYLGALACGDWAPAMGSACAPNLLLSPPGGDGIREGGHEKKTN